MKRKVYIFCFTVLGLLFGFLLHAFIEIWYIKMLIANYEGFGLGLSLESWFTIHSYFSVITAILGAWFGFRAGYKYWKILYVDQKYRKYFKHPLKKEF